MTLSTLRVVSTHWLMSGTHIDDMGVSQKLTGVSVTKEVFPLGQRILICTDERLDELILSNDGSYCQRLPFWSAMQHLRSHKLNLSMTVTDFDGMCCNAFNTTNNKKSVAVRRELRNTCCDWSIFKETRISAGRSGINSGWRYYTGWQIFRTPFLDSRIYTDGMIVVSQHEKKHYMWWGLAWRIKWYPDTWLR